jgi:hypothetical protein
MVLLCYNNQIEMYSTNFSSAKKIIKNFILCGILYFVVLPRHAHAYLDPGNGSYLFQILIASLLGASFFLKDGIKKIKSFFQKKQAKKESEHHS